MSYMTVPNNHHWEERGVVFKKCFLTILCLFLDCLVSPHYIQIYYKYGVYLICWITVLRMLLPLQLFLPSSWLCIYFYLPIGKFFITWRSPVLALSSHACVPYIRGCFWGWFWVLCVSWCDFYFILFFSLRKE